MRHFTTAVLERHTEYSGPFATEPYETAWASEAIFFIRTEEMVGDSVMLRAKVQISVDGIHWIDEGTVFEPITTKGDFFVRVSHFGGWLRLVGEVHDTNSAESVAKCRTMIWLVLKE